MQIYKLKPAVKDNLWGGVNLKEKFNKETDKSIIAETWELSFHPDGPCQVVGGEFDGKYLKEVIGEKEKGSACKKFQFFPLLIKLIDSAQNLSVQVHPSDEYALKKEGQFGKTEMWYIVDVTKEGAGIYCGFKEEITRERFAEEIRDGSIMNSLNFIAVKKGDCFFIPSGTVHAIGEGVTICEIQQNSNLTYRVYDYNRLDKDGKPRALHIEKAIEVADLTEYKGRILPRKVSDNLYILTSCKYFTVYKGSCDGDLSLYADDKSFNHLIFLEGEGKIENQPFKKGDSFFIPASYGEFKLSGKCEFILSKVD